MESWDRILEREVLRAGRVAVVGIGNVSRGDDAAGTLVARALLAGPAKPAETALVVPAGEAPENYTGLIRAFSPGLVVLVDCASGGRRPGDIFIVDPAAIAEEDVSTHRIPLSRLVRFIRETMECRVLVIGIEPSSIAEGRDVSPAVAAAVREAAAALRRALAAA